MESTNSHQSAPRSWAKTFCEADAIVRHMGNFFFHLILELIPHSKIVRWSVALFIAFVFSIWLLNR
jgi:hypothetical protein